jgi:nucleotide-binding universal stress UspA family protein
MKDIVVGLDGTEASSRALAYAVAEARAAGGGLRAVHAWTTPVWMGGIPGFGYNILATPEQSRSFAEDLLDHQVKELYDGAGAPDVRIRSEAVQGDARHALTKISRTADLLVVASHREGLLRGALLGSVAQHVLSHAHSPVMLVPADGTDPSPVGRVVVGADGSGASRGAMRWALEAARRHDCPLVVVHAWLVTTLPGSPSKHYVASLREHQTECQEWLDEEVRTVLPDHDGVPLSTRLSHTSASVALRETAGPRDQLVVGRRGRGGFVGLHLGSVAAQCAHYAQGVVVVVPA